MKGDRSRGGRECYKLTDEIRHFIVQRLGCFESPTQVAEAVQERWGVSITTASVLHYNPTTTNSKRLAKKWRAVFEATREAFIQHATMHVPEANKSVRLRLLADSARTLRARGNHLGAAKILKQIAEEMGNVYTNRREHTGKDGGPVRYENVSTMTDEQLETRLGYVLTQIGLDKVTQLINGRAEGDERTRH